MPTWSFQDSEWRQGTVIPRELVPDGVLPAAVDQEAKLVIITHDCDMVNDSYEAEPFVEFFIARPLPQQNKDPLTYRGRNPRRLQFWTRQNTGLQLYEISAHEKFRIERQRLEEHAPDQSLILRPDDRKTLAAWASKRYDRSAFPTAFNKRIPEATAKKIKASLKRDGDDVRIFMGLNSFDELSPEVPYDVAVRVVIPREAMEDDFREQRALSVVTALGKHLRQPPGINVIDVRLESEVEFTLEDWNSTLEWDVYDYLSMAGEEGPA